MSIRPGPEYRAADLDPLQDPERWEGLVARIGQRAAPILAERRAPPGVLDLVVRWARPSLATAASLLLLAAAGGLWLQASSPEARGGGVQIAQTILPPAFAGWVTGTTDPSVTELVRELETLNEVER